LPDEYPRPIHELAALAVFIDGAAGALTKAERQKDSAVAQAAPRYAKVMNSAPVLIAHSSPIARASDISSRTRSGYYDCLYVALAEREGCELITPTRNRSITSRRTSRSSCRWAPCREKALALMPSRTLKPAFSAPDARFFPTGRRSRRPGGASGGNNPTGFMRDERSAFCKQGYAKAGPGPERRGVVVNSCHKTFGNSQLW